MPSIHSGLERRETSGEHRLVGIGPGTTLSARVRPSRIASPILGNPAPASGSSIPLSVRPPSVTPGPIVRRGPNSLDGTNGVPRGSRLPLLPHPRLGHPPAPIELVRSMQAAGTPNIVRSTEDLRQDHLGRRTGNNQDVSQPRKISTNRKSKANKEVVSLTTSYAMWPGSVCYPHPAPCTMADHRCCIKGGKFGYCLLIFDTLLDTGVGGSLDRS